MLILVGWLVGWLGLVGWSWLLARSLACLLASFLACLLACLVFKHQAQCKIPRSTDAHTLAQRQDPEERVGWSGLSFFVVFTYSDCLFIRCFEKCNFCRKFADCFLVFPNKIFILNPLCVCVCLSVCLSLCLSVSLSVCV